MLADSSHIPGLALRKILSTCHGTLRKPAAVACSSGRFAERGREEKRRFELESGNR